MHDPSLILRLFGPLNVVVSGKPMPRVRTRSVEWLLALLAMRGGRTVDRSWLAGTLWPDSEEGQARHNLRNDLVELRNALGTEAGRIQSPTRSSLVLDLAGADVDLVRFQKGIAAGDEDSLRSAVDAYRGPLLEGCYEEWVVVEREALAARCLEAIDRLAGIAEARLDHEAAVRWLRRAEAMDPLRDSTVRRLMSALEAMRDAASALEVYRSFRTRLHEELSASPDDSTRSLFEQIRARSRERARSGPAPSAAAPNSRPSAPLAPETTADGERPALPPSFARPPHPLSPLIGREEEAASVQERLRNSRMVTLLGAGGVGKTRLAMEVAGRMDRELTGAAAWAELAPLSDESLVLPAVSAALGVWEDGGVDGTDPVRRIAAALGDRPCLLVLDNCEHLISAAAPAAESLLRACPNLVILATSRQRLGLPGEVLWRVPSLPAPDPRELPEETGSAVTCALGYPAVRMFMERAESSMPGFQLAERTDLEAVCTICRRLDGIPLALELAAARFGPLSLPQIADRLDDRFRLLARGSRAALPRHQTLSALIDWSYDLLSAEEQALLGCLCVFSGGWTLKAAEWILDLERPAIQNPESGRPHRAIQKLDALDLLTSLVERSLVIAEARGGETRYRMLETIREYAHGKLRQAGEEDMARRRHLEYVLEMAEREAADLFSPRPAQALDRLQMEADNLGAALSYARSDGGPPDSLLRLASALWLFWHMRGRYAEGREHLRAALDGSGDRDTVSRARALLGAAVMMYEQRDARESLDLAQKSLELFRTFGDMGGAAAAALHSGFICLLLSDLPSARAMLVDALAACLTAGWIYGRAIVLILLALADQLAGENERSNSQLDEAVKLMEKAEDSRTPSYCIAYYLRGVLALLSRHAGARSALTRCLAIARRTGEKRGIAVTLWALGEVAGKLGDTDFALSCFHEAVEIHRGMGNYNTLAYALQDVGNWHYRGGDYASACSAYSESLDMFRRLGSSVGLDTACNNLGSTLFHLGETDRARRLHGEALSHYWRSQNREGVVWSLERLAVVKAALGEPYSAAALLGAATYARDAFGSPMAPWDQADWDRAVASVRETLGDDAAFHTAWQEGREMSPEQAIEVAMQAGGD